MVCFIKIRKYFDKNNKQKLWFRHDKFLNLGCKFAGGIKTGPGGIRGRLLNISPSQTKIGRKLRSSFCPNNTT
jgi:hypothetical protein